MIFLLKSILISFGLFFSANLLNAQDVITIRNYTGCDIVVYGQMSTEIDTPCIACGGVFGPMTISAGGEQNVTLTAACGGVHTVVFTPTSGGAPSGYTQHPGCGGAMIPIGCPATGNAIGGFWIPINLTGSHIVAIRPL